MFSCFFFKISSVNKPRSSGLQNLVFDSKEMLLFCPMRRLDIPFRMHVQIKDHATTGRLIT